MCYFLLLHTIILEYNIANDQNPVLLDYSAVELVVTRLAHFMLAIDCCKLKKISGFFN